MKPTECCGLSKRWHNIVAWKRHLNLAKHAPISAYKPQLGKSELSLSFAKLPAMQLVSPWVSLG